MRPQTHSPSARQLRRAAERQQAARRTGRTVRRPVHIPMIVKADYVLAPLEAVLSQLELRGTLDVLDDGTPVFRAPSGELCQTAPAIDGIAEFFDQWARRHGRAVVVTPLRQIAKRMEYGMPIDAAMLDSVRDVLPDLRRIAGAMNREDAESLIRGTQIREELDRLEEV